MQAGRQASKQADAHQHRHQREAKRCCGIQIPTCRIQRCARNFSGEHRNETDTCCAFSFGAGRSRPCICCLQLGTPRTHGRAGRQAGKQAGRHLITKPKKVRRRREQGKALLSAAQKKFARESRQDGRGQGHCGTVCDKFETGYDNPDLTFLYIFKPLSGT